MWFEFGLSWDGGRLVVMVVFMIVFMMVVDGL